MTTSESRVAAIMITHNRREEVLHSLSQLCSLPEQPHVILVDNASRDGTAEEVTCRFPQVELIRAGSNLGAAARNLGVRQATAPYVALCDDDTWWEPGSLRRAAELLDTYPRAAVLTARLLNGPEAVEDSICKLLETSPLPMRGDLPGKPILGFLAGASVVRRAAFLEAGGFDRRFFIGGEEELLAIELAVRGWALCYVPELVVYHHPSVIRDSKSRSFHVVRNRLWVTWLRRPAGRALAHTLQAVQRTWTDAATARGVVGALAGLPWILRERRVVPPELEEQLSLLEAMW